MQLLKKQLKLVLSAQAYAYLLGGVSPTELSKSYFQITIHRIVLHYTQAYFLFVFIHHLVMLSLHLYV